MHNKNQTRHAACAAYGWFNCYAHNMDAQDTKLLALLEEKIAYHRARADFHNAAATAYENAATLQRGNVPTSPPKTPLPRKVRKRSGSSTAARIERILAESGSLTVAEVTQHLIESGWETSSADPVNNVRTQIGRMVDSGRTVKTADGRYAPPESDLGLQF